MADGSSTGGLSDQTVGLTLAISSSIFIGASFIVKKKGLQKAGSTGLRAGMGGYTYLAQPLWWAGMLSMIAGEIANFSAYAFAPAILVTPLGALSIIVSAILAHIMLNEKLNMYGILGCALCIVGSVTVVLHAPEERQLSSVKQVWELARQPGFMLYAILALVAVLVLIFYVAPEHGPQVIFVYIGICSIAGSLSVMSCKALGIALRLTFSGHNQLGYMETWCCAAVVAVCASTQINYLNKALDLFNTAIVSPIYYVMFTTLTIMASCIMFKEQQTATQIATEVCGFFTIVSGVFLLHATKDMDVDLHGLYPGAEAGVVSARDHVYNVPQGMFSRSVATQRVMQQKLNGAVNTV